MIKINHKKSYGYTLIELMIALFIFTIVSAMVLSALLNVYKSYESLKRHSTQILKLQLALTIIENDIEQMVNRSILDSNGVKINGLYVNRDLVSPRIEFTRMGYANPLLNEKRSTMQRIGYRFDNGDLIRENWKVLDRVNVVEKQTRKLLNNIESVEWKYFDRNKKHYTLWPPTSHWDNLLPIAISLTIKNKFLGIIERLFIIPEHSFMITGHTIEISK